ncbi:MAG: cation:proton antiporter [Gammaproteobacteria bacterium]|nr:cation:proton antiporter [Gammaproteobacteria bacterium]
MDFIWILFAFICGVSARFISLPPLIGYLIAGFVLNFIGFESSESLETLSKLGITLMLFTIGLKLNVKDLLQSTVWGSTVGHMGLWIGIVSSISIFPAMFAISYFAGLDWKIISLIAFALSFSSTVCIVKILEESGELKTRHGKLAVGILVMQDVVAVAFMAIATGIVPSVWAVGLIALFLVRKPIGMLLEKVGHGELLPLMGFFLAFGGYELFNVVGIKGDLGALILGIVLSGHKKSTELYKSLMSFKDLFLIGFFLSIGFTALPNLEMIYLSLAITLLLPIKSLLFFALFTAFKLRARTAFLSSLVLSNFSEFGLIVAAFCVEQSWLAEEWLVILALSVSFSFVLTSVIYRQAHTIYRNYKSVITQFESPNRPHDDTFVLPNDAKVLVIGMGRVGKGTYQSLCKLVDNNVWGIDADEDRIKRLNAQGFRVLFGDGEDADLWQNMDLSNTQLVLIALPYIQDIKNIQEQLVAANYSGKIVAIARYEDQIEQLTECGIDRIFNFYNEAGVGFAEESVALLHEQENKTVA